MLRTCLIAALIGGAVNGVLIGKVGLSFFVVTLGTLSLYRGIVNIWSDTETTYITSGFVDAIGFGKLAGVPYPVWIMVATYVVALVVLRWTYFGRDVYAVGGNITAARLSGINVARTLILVYAIAGLCAGIAGVIQAGRLGAASPLVGESTPLDAAAAVLLGGTSFLGGVGGVTGTAVGVLFIGTLQNGLSIAAVSSFWQQVVTGVILIVAIAIDRDPAAGRAPPAEEHRPVTASHELVNPGRPVRPVGVHPRRRRRARAARVRRRADRERCRRAFAAARRSPSSSSSRFRTSPTLWRAVGGAPEHAVSIQIYTTDMEAYRTERREIGERYRTVFGRHYPAMSLFEVSRLYDPAALVEIVCTAVIP